MATETQETTMVTEREAVGCQCDRLLSRVLVTDRGCWAWQGARFDGGYGALRFRGRQWKAHRVAFTIYKGEIPAGLVIDHLCHVRECVNPWHLEPVTVTENARRRDQSYPRPRPRMSAEEWRQMRRDVSRRYRERNAEAIREERARDYAARRDEINAQKRERRGRAKGAE